MNITITTLAAGIRKDLAAIETNNNDSLAHAIAAGEKLNRAKKMLKEIEGPSGRWLPWLKDNFELHQTVANDYMRLAENKGTALTFSSIREALAALPKKQQRKRKTKITQGVDARGVANNPDVIDWVAKQRKHNMTTKDVITASKGKDNGYPADAPSLTDGGVTSILAVLADRERRAGHEPTKPKKKEPRWSGKRLREINEEIKGGDNTQLKKLQKEIAHAVRALEDFSIPDLDWGTGINSELAGFVFDDVAVLAVWVNNASSVIVSHMDQMTIHRKIRAAQAIIDDPNASDGYRAAARAGIERLIEKKGLPKAGDSR